MIHEYEVSFKIWSERPWKRIPNGHLGGFHQEIHASDGIWYRVPDDAVIKDISPLREGYYLIEGHRSVYRYLIGAPHNMLELYNGSEWKPSDVLFGDSPEDWRDKAQYLGPLGPDDDSL